MNFNDVAARLRHFEGSIPHMYLCTGGKITIGVGHAIESDDEAGVLPFDQPVSIVDTDYRTVANAEPGLVASAYAALTTSRMSDTDIDGLLYEDIEFYEGQLLLALPNFGFYPEPAQEALFDMGYNLGITGLTTKFPTMLAAVDRGDWEVAAQECHRLGIPEERNYETAALFRQALTATTATPPAPR